MTSTLAASYRRLRVITWVMLSLLGAAIGLNSAAGQFTAPPPQRAAVVLDLGGPIGPASADYVMRGLTKAMERQSAVVVMKMDTPGGLDTSMRDIIRAILSSPVPVLTWVGPSGARAASAGTYILYASHIAAMAPGTNVGAATPVAIGGGFGQPGRDDREREREPRNGDGGGTGGQPQPGQVQPADGQPQPGQVQPADGQAQPAPGSARPGQVERDRPRRDRAAPGTPMEAKAINDAVAYIQSLAELRGRNVEWAESAVRDASSLGAVQAQQQNVIDIVATGIDHLLRQAHGREVTVLEERVTLDTRDLVLDPIDPDWRNRLLGALTNPNLALILMMIGFYGLLFEFMNPGALYPGTIGAISLLIGLFSLSALPVNYAGIALMVLGLALIVAEMMTPSLGILGIGGTIALVLGATILIDTDMPGFQVSWPLIAGVAVAGLMFALLAGRAAMRARRFARLTGREGMMGQPGRVLQWTGDAGYVWAAGERWHAVSDSPLAEGQLIRVVAMEGLTLTVEPDLSKNR